MKIINEIMSIDELKNMAEEIFGDMIKGVVDIDKEIIAINAELPFRFRIIIVRKWLSATKSLGNKYLS